jgi:hypothetical protein
LKKLARLTGFMKPVHDVLLGRIKFFGSADMITYILDNKTYLHRKVDNNLLQKGHMLILAYSEEWLILLSE